MEHYVTLEQMAIALGLKDVSALRHAIRRGILQAERVGRHTWIVSLAEMERYAVEHRGRRGRPAKRQMDVGTPPGD